MAGRLVHHFHGPAEMAGHHVRPLGDFLRGIALTCGRGGGGGVIFRLRRGVRLRYRRGLGQVHEEGQRVVPGVLGQIEFDDALPGRAADGRLEAVFGPVEVEDRALAIGAGLAVEVVADCVGAALNFGSA